MDKTGQFCLFCVQMLGVMQKPALVFQPVVPVPDEGIVH